MSTTIRRRSGGYFSMPNRWVDSGYMAAAPGSITQVYLFLCRWSDNETLQSAQPMRLISKKCGVSEDVARKAVRTLEAWGVMERDAGSGRSAANVWTLNELPDHAPEYPDKRGPKQSGGPQQTAPPQSRGPYQPKSINGANAPERTSRPAKEKTFPEDGPAQVLVKVFCEELGLGFPAGYGKMVGQAQRLHEAGVSPDEMRRIVAWLISDPYWQERGIDIGIALSQLNKWRSSSASKSPIRSMNPADYGYHGSEGVKQFQAALERGEIVP